MNNMTTATKFTKGAGYTFAMASGARERVTYIGKNHQGMHRFAFSDGQLWTGYTAPVVAE